MAIGGMIVGKSFVTLMVDDTTRTITEGQPNYTQIREAIKIRDMALVEKLINIATSIKQYMAGKITIDNGQVFYGHDEIKGAVVDRILDMMNEGFDHEPMVKFLENLMQNPSKRAVDELYKFLESTSLPITEDGHFLAYKKVRGDYRDFYTGTMDNSVGQTLEMPRNGVDEDKDRTCSAGLHFCSLSYLSAYHGGNGRVVIVKINPRDVVAIPSDYNNAKGRACRYEIIGEHTSEIEEAFDKPVWSDRRFEDAEDNWLDDEDTNSDWSDEEEDNYENEDDNEDDAYNLGWARGYDSYTDISNGGVQSYNNNPPTDVDPDYHEFYKNGYSNGWQAAKLDKNQSKPVLTPTVSATVNPVSGRLVGYNQGRKDAAAGLRFNDHPAAHAMVVNDLDAYRKGYAKGWDSIKIG